MREPKGKGLHFREKYQGFCFSHVGLEMLVRDQFTCRVIRSSEGRPGLEVGFGRHHLKDTKAVGSEEGT